MKNVCIGYRVSQQVLDRVFVKKSLKIRKDEKFVKVCLHSDNLTSLQFDDFLQKVRNITKDEKFVKICLHIG